MRLISDMNYKECEDAKKEYLKIESEIAKSENNIDELTKKLAILDKKIPSVCIRDPGEEGPW